MRLPCLDPAHGVGDAAGGVPRARQAGRKRPRAELADRSRLREPIVRPAVYGIIYDRPALAAAKFPAL